MTTTAKTALAGAVSLNVPIVIAGSAALPPAALIATALPLAAIGATLGWLVGWSFSGHRHELIELFPATAQPERLAA